MLHNHTTTSLDLQLDITKIASITIHNLLPSMVDLQHERACQQERGDLQAMLWKLDLPLPDEPLKLSEFEQSLGVWMRFSRARDGGFAMYLTALHAFVDRASERRTGTQSTASFLRLPSLELFDLFERPASRLLATVEACLALLLPLDMELATLEDALLMEWEHASKLLEGYYSGGEERGTGLKLQETRHEDIPVAEVCILNPLRAGVSESDVFAIHYLINELHRHQLFLRPVLRSYAELRDAVEDVLYTAVARLLELSPKVAGRLLMRPRVAEVVSRKVTAIDVLRSRHGFRGWLSYISQFRVQTIVWRSAAVTKRWNGDLATIKSAAEASRDFAAVPNSTEPQQMNDIDSGCLWPVWGEWTPMRVLWLRRSTEKGKGLTWTWWKLTTWPDSS